MLGLSSWIQHARMCLPCTEGKGMVLPYNDNSAGDGDPSHEAMGDGVRLVGVADGVVIAVEAPLVWGVHQCQDDEGQRCCKTERR